MFDLKEALLAKFSEIMPTYEYTTVPKNQPYPYATFNTPSTDGFAEYRDDVTVEINIYDSLCNSLKDIEDYALEFRKLNKYCFNTEQGRLDMLFVGIVPLDSLEEEVRRREITFLVKWYDENFFPEEG